MRNSINMQYFKEVEFKSFVDLNQLNDEHNVFHVIKRRIVTNRKRQQIQQGNLKYILL